ncbi:hypothetical protein ACSSWA_10140 [Melioribacter sp. Ez-97]|uniref:hypothetical protein n=1 Tax=Melioribacter sp. Ez-97 TaxID=3423434 RepID=UPI003EDAF5BB
MKQNHNNHKFHIPVLGVGYSVDAPVKVAKYGISSVISLVDDTLLEKMREHHLKKRNKIYIPIETNEYDSRAKRTRAYLNAIDEIVKEDFEKVKRSSFGSGGDIDKYFEMLPQSSPLKKEYETMLSTKDAFEKNRIEKSLREKMIPGSIDVNIMTKVDKKNYGAGGVELDSKFNDAHAALRGFAMSSLSSKVIFSAGMNPRLYGYISSFEDFYPDNEGNFKKKVVIKVSDFRSALIQGKFLAKKGIWISEFRVESGLNCGGHAFATDGYLLGPILEEFKNRKTELLTELKKEYLPALLKKGYYTDESKLDYDLTVQGGVGKSSEQEFLVRHYGVKSVGWGSLFLLAPDVINIDEYTLDKLLKAREEDLYLSEISPLGVPFNNLRNNSKDIEKYERVELNKPGSPCPKKFLVSNTEFSEKPICTASKSYVKKKIEQLKNEITDPAEYKRQYEKVIDKACLCEGLTVSPLINHEIPTPKQSRAVSVCPGPNIAYYSKRSDLRGIVDHIYGRINLITDSARPNFFIKELRLYIDYYKNLVLKKVDSDIADRNKKNTEKYLTAFKENIINGISYYKRIVNCIYEETGETKEKMTEALNQWEEELMNVMTAEKACV